MLEEKLPFDFSYDGNKLDDSVPNEGDIARTLFRIRSRKAAGLSKISFDHLKTWYKIFHPKEGDEEVEEEEVFIRALESWNLVVELVQWEFGRERFQKLFPWNFGYYSQN